MKVRIICYEDVNAWILGKFAIKMQGCLQELGIECDISKHSDSEADINHHIVYGGYNCIPSNNDTLMITHVDDSRKLNHIIKSLETAKMGICMSKQVMEWLVQMGADRTKLCFVDPAHDEVARPKKFIIGLASRVYPDGRKRESFLNHLALDLDSEYFHFKIMGQGWERQVTALEEAGFSVDYYPEFNREVYYPMIESLDYYLYMGHDEGQMGFVDAAAAGVRSIVTPQGYHLDAIDALTDPFDTYEELLSILLNLQNQRKKIINSVSTWTWLDYTKKHLEIWKMLLGVQVDSKYEDGINSYFSLNKNESVNYSQKFAETTIKKLDKVKKRRLYRDWKYRVSNEGFYNTIKYAIKRIFRK